MLRLSYVVPDAKWVSRYELSINTPSSTARLTYGAEFENKSSETWQDARVTLSTSQTSFSGLSESIPSLQVWHVKLISSQDDSNEQPSWEKIICSLPEVERPAPNRRAAQRDRERQLALLEQQNKRRLLMARQEQDSQQAQKVPQARCAGLFSAKPQAATSGSLFGQGASRTPMARQGPTTSLFSAQPQAATSGSLFGRAPQTGAGLFGQQLQTAPPEVLQAAPPQRHQDSSGADPPTDNYHEEGDNDEDSYGNGDEGDEILSPPNLEYQDSVRQEYGLTTTYDLPGRRTLVPSSVNRRHALAKLDFKTVTLQHVIVPKHRAAAFFRARVRNTSSIQILRGRVGMTVDGTFLGTTSMPNCAPNDVFDISLGVDPSIAVTYAKPTVRRETSGFFTKEDTAIFRRSCWMKNTKSIAASIIVLDQVPMSNDEKLQMAILEPKGLAKEGDKVTMAVEADKGKGVVTMGKDGEVKWVMQLEPGKDVRMVLEYEMKAPRGNDVSAS